MKNSGKGDQIFILHSLLFKCFHDVWNKYMEQCCDMIEKKIFKHYEIRLSKQ